VDDGTAYCLLWRIFSSKKSAPAFRKTGFYATVIRTSRRLDSFLHEAALLKYSRVKLKNQNPIVVDVLFKASSGTTLM
jgi:hypothetical protein